MDCPGRANLRARSGAPGAVTGRNAPPALRHAGTPAWTAILALGAAHVAWLRFCYDDAFVSFRYAANLVHGHGLVYNVGERVEGYSNFLWTLVLSLVIAAGGEPAFWSQVIGAVFALASLALVIRLAPRVGAVPVWAGLLVATNTAWAAWGTGGLETAMFGCFVTAGVLALVLADHDSRRAYAVSGLAFGLACLTRPDGVVLAAATGATLAVRVALGRAPRAGLVWWLGLLALCALPHLIWRHAYYGHWLPNTFGVKQPGAGRLAQGTAYLAGAVRDLHLGLLAIPLAVVPFVRARRTRTDLDATRHATAVESARARGVVYGLVLLVTFGGYLASTGGDFMPLYRFVAPLVPLLALAAAAAWTALTERVAARARELVTAIAWIAFAAYAGLHVVDGWRQQSVWSEGEMVSVGWSRQEMDEWLRIGDLLRIAAQPTDTLATTAAGAIPYRSGLPTLDLHGLSAPDLSRYRRRASERPGHQWMLKGRWLDAHPPQILLGHPLVHPTAASLTVGIDLEPEWRDRVLAHYELVGMRLAGTPVRFVGCAVRRDAVDRIIEAASAGIPTPP